MRLRTGTGTALALALLLAGAGLPGVADATVIVTGPANGNTFFFLDIPDPSKPDETALSGFELLISSRSGEFREADQYLISGEDTQATTSLATDLGTVSNLSGTPFSFSVQHNLTGGRNFTFSVTNLATSTTTAQCWGLNCASGSLSTQLLNGIPPISDYNGLQVQARAQDVAGSSVDLEILGLSGVTLSGEALFDEVVTPSSTGTILPGDLGRRAQWFMGDSLDLVQNEWELTGLVTLSRPDAATSDLTKVRIAVDLVRDPRLPFLVPEPSVALLLGVGLIGLVRARR